MKVSFKHNFYSPTKGRARIQEGWGGGRSRGGMITFTQQDAMKAAATSRGRNTSHAKHQDQIPAAASLIIIVINQLMSTIKGGWRTTRSLCPRLHRWRVEVPVPGDTPPSSLCIISNRFDEGSRWWPPSLPSPSIIWTIWSSGCQQHQLSSSPT